MIEGIFHLEAQSNREDVARTSLENLVNKLKQEDKTEVTREDLDEVIETDGMFSATGEVEAKFEDLTTYLLAAIKYGPSAIEIQEPAKIVLSAKEFLIALGEIIKLAKNFYTKYQVSFKFGKVKGKVGLDEEAIDGLLDQGAIRAKIIVESKGKSRREVINAFAGAVKGDVFVNKAKTKQMEKGDGFEGLVGIDAFMYEPKTLVDIAVKHTPVLVEIVEPEEIELSMLDLQDIGVDLASIFFEASHIVLAR
ncbi:MAG: hypothetical protein V3T58_08035 [Candidatus Hydrothermarchaeales archaeon]